jgi:hypothetical protein
MRTRVHLRRAQVTRPVSAVLTAVLLALSVSAGFHRGDHDDLGWLPSRFHHHDFHWRAGTGEEPAPLTDHCLACHVSRALVRLSPPATLPPATPDLVPSPTAGMAGETAARPDFSRIPRAPPAS